MSMHGIGLASAFRTLTILPFPGRECKSPATSLYWFPVVGMFLGFCCFMVGSFVTRVSSPTLGAALSSATLVMLTRAFHLDGLADMADGFGGGQTRERVLGIMKDSHVGAFGVIAVVMLLIVKFAAFSVIYAADAGVSVIGVLMLSRTLVVLQSVGNAYARPEGGTAGLLVNESKVRHALVASLQAAAYLVFVSTLDLAVMAWVVGTGVLVTLLVAWRARVRIGGVTGDVLGATAELGETAMLVALALAMHLP